MAGAFAAQAAYCTSREDTAHFAFHGCIDWHSAVHGAWALAAYQQVTGDTRYAAQLEANLAPDLIAQEMAYVRERPRFEMPYGRAWLLRLAVTWRALHPQDQRLEAFADETAASLLAYYESWPPDPRLDRYDNPSWALINLLHYARARGDEAMAARVEAMARAHFITPRCDLALEDEGFLAVCVSWAWLMSQVLAPPEFRAWYADWNPGLETLQPVRAFPSAHDYGRNFSRAWGLYWLGEALDSDSLRASYSAHVAAGYTPQSQWRGDYGANGHWVAQFGMLAIAPLFEANAKP